jgi:hypothetical protein
MLKTLKKLDFSDPNKKTEIIDFIDYVTSLNVRSLDLEFFEFLSLIGWLKIALNNEFSDVEKIENFINEIDLYINY